MSDKSTKVSIPQGCGTDSIVDCNDNDQVKGLKNLFRLFARNRLEILIRQKHISPMYYIRDKTHKNHPFISFYFCIYFKSINLTIKTTFFCISVGVCRLIKKKKLNCQTRRKKSFQKVNHLLS